MGEHIQFIAQHYLWLFPLGLFAGAYGTLIGAGGGFILVPVLLLLYPGEAPETITSISLAVVFFNALSGTLAYARQQRIDYRSGAFFSLATIPGAIVGALSTAQIPRQGFDTLFGTVMIAAAGLLVVRPGKKRVSEQKLAKGLSHLEVNKRMFPLLSKQNLMAGIGLSCILGYVSSFLGVGAGFLYVPALVYLLDFPVHVATATSQFMLAIMAFGGSATHVMAGLFHHGARRTLTLAVGVMLGAQIGARLSRHVRGDWILRGLAIALVLIGFRLVISV